jgi:hypothetical protein
MFYPVLNAPRSPPKAINWSGIKNVKSSNEVRRSWYPSIDKMYFWVYVKFVAGLSIPFTRKKSSKKVKLFPRSVLSAFFLRVAYSSEARWTTHHQISQVAQCNPYLSTETQKQAFLFCMRPWTLREALQKRPIGVVSKMANHPRKSGFLGISR